MAAVVNCDDTVSGGESDSDKESEGRFGGVSPHHRQDELDDQIQV